MNMSLELREKICNIMNFYENIPLDTKYFILKDILNEIYNILIISDKMQQTEKEKKYDKETIKKGVTDISLNDLKESIGKNINIEDLIKNSDKIE